ncbi:hypothetical protein ASPACDRAFT_35680 [Aspergillus aculeatus ATCC 16872]|uniref:Zn(2)-C6 fungal-type domain-containing protein n=1 Tax=Aspergillus aculeatus (strain ATCC 16872 / CBS 172.66 / WB 5094) TaxID=690307 RepID=A0A1L9WHW9_ASPA1|nr:uncharacterized protein ASPACDRAFT_35680 [Aspergillus aculeatus ATCC 16872]OJJ95784.1 hypothetical protein ASPACDRAFT_35680 [Aspergillus aculeatus ATCC 16872]
MMFSFHARRPSPHGEPSRGPRPKRAKIRNACEVCKIRKTKCDGAKPVCGPCSNRKRVSRAPRMACSYRESDPAEHSGYTTEQSPRGRPESDHADRASSFSTIVPSGSLFGASSGVHIMPNVGHQTSIATPENKTPSRSQAFPDALRHLPKLQNRPPRNEHLDFQFVIPPRKQADNLLGLYWDYVDSAYPWLDRPSIESAYETLWIQDGELTMNETVLHCLLNLMFATSCVATQGEPPLVRYESSVVFFERAQALMSYQLLDLYNFEIIQILLLTAVYLQHDKEPQKCFRIIGTAIHIAQELRLHIPETTEAMDNPKERDLARQVWNGCVIMDRICSMTFGCALKVPQSVAKEGLNLLVPNAVEHSSDSATASLPSKVNFYRSFCRLHHIIGDVIDTFYKFGESKTDRHASKLRLETPSDSSSLVFDKFASLFRIDSALNDWARGLHPFFQMPSEVQDPTPTKHITREANILRARLSLLQIHQGRTENARGTGLYADDDQIMPHVVLQCQINCTKAAADMIEFIIRNSPEQKQAYILPSNWYTVSYVYMAVTNLLAAQTSPQIVQYFTAAHLQGVLQKARRILKDYEKHATLTSRCNSVLALIEQNVGGREPRVDYTPSEAVQASSTHLNTSAPDLVIDTQGPPASLSSDLAMMDNYSFDWNEWPMFFSQLGDDTPTAQGWAISSHGLIDSGT